MRTGRLDDLKVVNNEGFAFDSQTGNTYSLNATGLLVINGIKAGASTEAIIAQLIKRFDVDQLSATQDLEFFFNQLERNRLIKPEVFV